MDIYLIRHAKAKLLGESGIETDEDRPLTEEGEQQARLLGQALLRQDIELDAILTTPLVRAQRTAQIIAQQWSPNAPEVIVSDRLNPPCKPRKMGRVLRDIRRDRVAIVGHQPDLGIWTAWLIGSKKAYVDFAKGGAAYIYWESELSKGAGALIWLVTPKWYTVSTKSPDIQYSGEGIA